MAPLPFHQPAPRMLTALALDDEPLALEVVQELAGKVRFLQLQACFTNCFEALDYLQNHPVDLLFLDINMPDINGIDWLQAIPNPPLVIFTTAYSEYAVKSYELAAVDYLLKPFSFARFLAACNKASEQCAQRAQPVAGPPAATAIFVKSGYEHVRVELAALHYVESVGNYVQFVSGPQKVLARLTMREAEALLPTGDFVRIHRSYLVAKRHIWKIDKRQVWLPGIELPLGAGYCPDWERLTP